MIQRTEPRLIIYEQKTDPGNVIDPGGFGGFTVALPGARVGDILIFNHPASDGVGSQVIWHASITAANLGTVIQYNPNAGSVTVPALTHTFLVIRMT